ncbi:DNA topoisomerase IB [Dokdonella sp.]|uniref:DNA topoisomerase IB n=1 Tax=Dokdonella sp. TaxID=2291710 RepID=UPI001B2BF7C8|nr:DNA topoisomerase IB [Dokdonella sp.]MBO9662859.1 DNA topoisomerase IB [Dokdonella sp.]
MRLRYVSDAEPGYARHRRGRGFAYVDSRGRPLRDARALARIRALAIPPAYTDVWICRSADGHLQATGRDERGRKQYRYHAAWRTARDGTKFARTIAFADALPALRRRIARDLRERGMPREKVIAAILRLLDRTQIRVGNEEYARSNGSYGLSTLRSRHARVLGDEVRFVFRGKSGRRHQVALSDARVAAVIRRCRDLPGQRLFQYVAGGRVHGVTSTHVNAYLRDVTRGEFTAKDFRTWSATVIVARELLAQDVDETRRATLKSAIESAADALGNTPAVCQRAYVHPLVLEAVAGAPAQRLRDVHQRTPRGRAGLDRIERAVLRFLRNSRRRS